jgi:hypothetical protein
VLPLSELPFPVSPPSGQTRRRIYIDVTVRCRHFTFSSTVESHNLRLPFSSPLERVYCHFLQFSSYRQRFTVAFYLSRDSTRLWARSYFLSAGKTPHLSLVSETTLCSFSAAQRLLWLDPYSAPRFLRSTSSEFGTYTVPLLYIVTCTCQFVPFWLRASSG